MNADIHQREESDMELSNLEAANYDAMIAEEAILEWLLELASNEQAPELDDEFLLDGTHTH
ncbi:MAG: hypothetical protein Kow0020_10840 [Wenzhouxiangellaceae bacterium]